MLKNLLKLFTSKSRRRPMKNRPRLEILEDRTVPAIFIWKGTTSSEWTDASNWNSGGLNRAPNSGDDIYMPALPAGGVSPKIKAGDNITCLTLNGADTFDGTGLTIDGTLKITQGGYWLCNKSINGSGSFRINGLFVWDAGDISVSSVYVFGGTSSYLRIGKDADNLLSPNVYVGIDNLNNASTGAILLSPSIDRMNGNLTLGNNTVIWVKNQGTFDFGNDQNSSTKGGISVGTTNNRIDNEGRVRFLKKDTNNESLHVGVSILNNTFGAYLIFGDSNNSPNVHFNDPSGGGYSIGNVNGTVEVYSASVIDLDDSMVVGNGEVDIKETANNGSTWINGDLTFNGGTFNVGFDDDVQNLQTLYVNNFSFINGTLELTVDGDVADSADKIISSGNASVSGGTLHVVTLGNVAAAGKKWDVIQTTGNVVGGTDFSSFTWAGVDLVGYSHQRTLTNYRLSKPVAIGGAVWNDTNQDGIRQNTETFKSGVAVYLYNSSGTLVASTGTNGYGQYSFSNVPVGTYYVVFVVNGMTTPHFSSADQGSDDTIDSDVVSLLSSGTNSATGKTSNFTLTGDLTNLDAGVWF